MCNRIFIKIAFVIIARSPQMLFRNSGISCMIFESHLINVRRTGKIFSDIIIHTKYFRDNPPCIAVAVWIHPSIRSPENRCIIFIVSGPQRKARMLTEPSHMERHFFFQLFQKFFRLRISSARFHKILPYKNSFFIADFIKLIRFVIASAPAADHITIQIQHQVQSRFDFIFSSGWERIQRNPVCSKDENFFVIHKETEFSLPFFTGKACPIEFHAADSETEGPGSKERFLLFQANFHLI